jgi:hypothetical protein
MDNTEVFKVMVQTLGLGSKWLIFNHDLT